MHCSVTTISPILYTKYLSPAARDFCPEAAEILDILEKKQYDIHDKMRVLCTLNNERNDSNGKV